MDNLHLPVIAVVFYFNLPGSVGTTSQQILPATHPHSECRWDGQFLLNCSFTRISTIPEDTAQTAVTADLSYNNITTFVCSDGRNEERMLKHLNLSNNLISELSLATCTNLPVLETLNLNGNAIHTLLLDMPTPAHGSKMYSIADRLLPALKVLSVERNNLNTVPRGLGLLQSLQTVHMSSNAIQQIDPKDFQNCSQLKDIDLRNNKITKIHPDAFRNLNKLQVVDLRENALTVPLPQMLVSLNFFQFEVYLSRNAWIFNCRLNAFKDLFHFVFDSTRKKWSLSYNKSANNIQKPVLYLSSFHLNCRDNVLLKRATVPTGNTSVLTCNLDNIKGNGISWWTPKGRISKNRSLPHMTLDKMNNLVIYNAEKTAAGLYLCLFNTTKEKHLIYNVEVKEKVSAFLVRKARDTNTIFRQNGTEPNFALAVSLSVLITFVCAFCLGAFARPYLESLWRVMRRKKNSGSDHTYSNQAFSDGTLSRESPASKPTNTQRHVLFCDEESLRNTQIFPRETPTVYENVSRSGVHPPNPKTEYQKQSNTKINTKKTPVFSKVQTSTDNNESINVYDTGVFFAGTDYENSNEITPNSKVRNNSGLLQSEITKATPDSPKRKGIVSHNEPRHTKKFMQGRQSCEEQLGLNGNKNIPSDVGDFISYSSSRRDADIENSSIYEIIKNSPLTEHDCKRIYSDEKDASADMFGDSSSAEGAPFTMSDCSSLADSELEQADVSDNLPVCQSSPEEASTDSGSEKYSTPPESPNITAELQQIWKNKDENSACFETTINYGSDTTMRETASPYTDKLSGHVSVSDPDRVSSSNQEIPDTFDYFANAESTVQNSTSDSHHSQSTDFDNTDLKLKHFPTYDTEKTSEEDELQLSLLPREPQHFLSYSHTEQKENAPVESTDEHIARNSPEKNHGEADITLRRNMSTSEDNNFIFAPIDPGLNEVVKNPLLLHPSKESSLQLLPEHTTEKHLMSVTQQDDLLPQGKQACADKMQGGSEEKNSDGFTELQDTTNCSLPEERQSCNPTALHLHSFGKTQSDFTRDDHFQLDESDEDAHSPAIPPGLFNEGTPDSSCSFPQKPTGNTVSENTDSSKIKSYTTLTELENHSATDREHLQNSRENLSQKRQTNSEQDQVFAEKNRAFDGFTELQDTPNCSLPEERQSCNPTVLHLHSFGKMETQSDFTRDDHFQLDESDEDAHSPAIPPDFFNESTPDSSCSFPQKPAGNRVSENTDSSKIKSYTTLTELENHSATDREHLQNSRENLSQKSQTNSEQDQVFVKKKRAFDGFTELQDTTNCSLPEERQSCNPTVLHLHSFGKMETQSDFTRDDHFQLDESDEDAHSPAIPPDLFNEGTPDSSCSFPQKPAGNTVSENTDSSKIKSYTTLTELENHSATDIEYLQNSREKLSQKSQTNSEQGQVFVKKKRAFDGFVNILQSRRTNFSS